MTRRRRDRSQPFCGVADTAEGATAYTCTLSHNDGHRQHEANLAVTSTPGGTARIANLLAPHRWIAEPPSAGADPND